MNWQSLGAIEVKRAWQFTGAIPANCTWIRISQQFSGNAPISGVAEFCQAGYRSAPLEIFGRRRIHPKEEREIYQIISPPMADRRIAVRKLSKSINGLVWVVAVECLV